MRLRLSASRRSIFAGLLTAFIGGIVPIGAAQATTITYTETSIASGSIADPSDPSKTIVFTDALLTLHAVGDTANVQLFMGSWINIINSMDLTIEGVGPVTFTAAVNFVFAQPGDPTKGKSAGGGFATGGIDILGTINSSFATYDLTTAFGPITDIGDFFSCVSCVGTNLGNLDLTSLNGDTTFTATISQTPLPAALPLFATGFGALGLFGWRRKRKAQAVAA